MDFLKKIAKALETPEESEAKAQAQPAPASVPEPERKPVGMATIIDDSSDPFPELSNKPRGMEDA